LIKILNLEYSYSARYNLLISYIKIYGPPTLKAIRALEKIAVGMPDVCIMDTVISREIPPYLARDIGATQLRSIGPTKDALTASWASGYFNSSGVSITTERCNNIISSSGESLGEYDFFFEWLEKSTPEHMNELVEKIDEALAPLGCLYTITTKR
jgi:hypothetical protein